MKLTKAKATELFVLLTGHNKTFISKHIKTSERFKGTAYKFGVGHINYEAWLNGQYIYVLVMLNNNARDALWFEFETLEPAYDKQIKEDREAAAALT